MSEIYKFIKNNKGHRKGVLIGIEVDNIYGVGYSLCNLKLDKFDKERALHIARERAYKNIKNIRRNELFKFSILQFLFCNSVPPSIEKEYISFANRCNKYFKDKL